MYKESVSYESLQEQDRVIEKRFNLKRVYKNNFNDNVHADTNCGS